MFNRKNKDTDLDRLKGKVKRKHSKDVLDDSNQTDNTDTDKKRMSSAHAGSRHAMTEYSSQEMDDSSEEEQDEDMDSSTQEGESGSEEESAEQNEEYEAIRKELSDMPFEDLIKLKQRLGTKVYNQVVNRGSQSDPAPTRKKKFKRENKNRPMEMSSKKRVSVVRDVIPVKKKVNRDPRFDDLSGEFNEHFFNKTYSFLGDLKVREREKVQKALKKQKNPEKKKELMYLANRMQQQEMSEKQKEKRHEIEKQWKVKEQERVKEGKTPFYLKKADKRKLELAEKYKELKKSGKIDKYLNKKRKKNSQKEKRKLPT